MSEAMQSVAGVYLGLLLVCLAGCAIGLLRNRLEPAVIRPIGPRCGAVERISGYVCTLEPGHDRPRHLDETHGLSFGKAHTTDHTTEGTR